MANKPTLLRSRIAALESLLIWEGEIANSRLRDLFDLKSVQASRLIAAFKTTHPKALKADSRTKRFVAAGTFRPTVSSGSLADYLGWLTQAFADGSPAIEDARIDLTRIEPSHFAALRQACLNGSGLRIRYESMNHPKGIDREIYPSTLVRVGRRWHARAWCCSREDYRDFNLGRIRSVAAITNRRPRLPVDELWRKRATVFLQAHRELSPEQAAVIRRESFGGKRRRPVNTRACHVSYVIQDLQAAVEPGRQGPPYYQIEVANVSALKPYLFLVSK
jgi:hypothetical protein